MCVLMIMTIVEEADLLLFTWRAVVVEVFSIQSCRVGQPGSGAKVGPALFTHTSIHTRIHTHTHIYIHTHIPLAERCCRLACRFLDDGRRMFGEDFHRQMYRSPRLWLGLFARCDKNPLHVATALGHTHVVQLLMDYGFDVNVLDKIARVKFSVSEAFRLLRPIAPTQVRKSSRKRREKGKEREGEIAIER